MGMLELYWKFLLDIHNLQALPLYLDKIFNQFVAILLSVTFVLFFGEVHFIMKYIESFTFLYSLISLEYDSLQNFTCQVIPQAICTRYGLAVGANFVWLVRVLMIICYPISYPIGKVIGVHYTVELLGFILFSVFFFVFFSFHCFILSFPWSVNCLLHDPYTWFPLHILCKTKK